MSIIVAEKEGGGYAVPIGGAILFSGLASALSADWVVETDMAGMYVKGADVGGAADTPAGAETHVHTNPLTVSNVLGHSHLVLIGSSASGGGTKTYAHSNVSGVAGTNHTHDVPDTTTNVNGEHDHTMGSTLAASNHPSYVRLYWIKAVEEVMPPVGGVIMFTLNQASIPEGYQLCDGTNGTYDLRNKFIYGASQDAEVGAAGGADTHVHGNPNTGLGGGHDHTLSGTTGGPNKSNLYGYNSGGTQASHSGHAHPYTATLNADLDHDHPVGNTGAASSIPPSLALYYIQRIS